MVPVTLRYIVNKKNMETSQNALILHINGFQVFGLCFHLDLFHVTIIYRMFWILMVFHLILLRFFVLQILFIILKPVIFLILSNSFSILLILLVPMLVFLLMLISFFIIPLIFHIPRYKLGTRNFSFFLGSPCHPKVNPDRKTLCEFLKNRSLTGH